MLIHYIRSYHVHLLGAKPPLSLNPSDAPAAVQRPLTVFQRAILASPHLRLNKLEKTDFYCYLRATRVLFSNVYAYCFVVMVGH